MKFFILHINGYSLPEIVKYFLVSVIWLTFASTSLIAQTQAEENLWEEVIGGAVDNNEQITYLKQYVQTFCIGGQSGFYCNKAKAMLERLQQFESYAVNDKCANLVILEEKAECVKSRLIEFPNNRKLSKELTNLEVQLWSSISQKSEEWNIGRFERFLNIFENSSYYARASSILDFLKLGNELDALTYFEKHVEGKGKDRLAYFESLHRGNDIAQKAKKQAQELEEIVWQNDKDKNTETAYQHYLKFYPNGRYAKAANQNIRTIYKGSLGKDYISSPEKLRWTDVVSHSSNPEVVLDFISTYPKSSFIAEARNLYDKLDEEAWLVAKEIDSEIAYNNYINTFPNGTSIDLATKLLPQVENDTEDLLWSETLQLDDKSSYEAFITQYPNSKYISDAKLRLRFLQELEYRISKSGAIYQIRIVNASNIRISEQSSDSISFKIVDKVENIIDVAVIESGQYHFKVTDENNKEITVYLSDLISIEVFKTEPDSVFLLVQGGLKPYIIFLQDTFLTHRNKPLTKAFDSELIGLSNSEIVALMDAGIYTVLVKDDNRRNTAIAGVVNLSKSFGDTLKQVLTYLGILLGLFLLWYVLKNKLLKKKSIYDQDITNDDEWD